MWRAEECKAPWTPAQYSQNLHGHYRAAQDFASMFLQVQSKGTARALEPWAAYSMNQFTTCSANKQCFDTDLKWKAPQVRQASRCLGDTA
jgi:hypothetical protein